MRYACIMFKFNLLFKYRCVNVFKYMYIDQNSEFFSIFFPPRSPFSSSKKKVADRKMDFLNDITTDFLIRVLMAVSGWA